jgi:16S rRNA (uracil1498-N3)-methyltransferase
VPAPGPGPATDARALVFVEDLDGPRLSAADDHHLRRVLRLRPGDLVAASDGAGRWRPCRFGPGPGLAPDGEVLTVARPAPAVTVAFALTKGERPEWAVQKLCELGVDRIVAFAAERSVVRWDNRRAEAAVERWRRIAREAAAQSRRVWLPVVDEVSTFAAVAAGAPPPLIAVPGGPPLPAGASAVLIGPEGGWSAAELDLAAGRGLGRVGLGPHVLRAETAALAAGALLCGLRAGLVSPTGGAGGPP